MSDKQIPTYSFRLPSVGEMLQTLQQSPFPALTWVQDDGTSIDFNALFDNEEALAAYLESNWFSSSTDVYHYDNTESGEMWLATTRIVLGVGAVVSSREIVAKWDNIWKDRAKRLKEKLDQLKKGNET